ncbi:cysteine dioxygenase type 1 [Obelidium mucronatum]|nr:cysteine dioxygenase type 1 [Obelidium mucronatum]
MLKKQKRKNSTKIMNASTETVCVPHESTTRPTACPKSLSDLINFLHSHLDDKGINEMETVDVDKIQAAMEAYVSNIQDWSQFRHFDIGRYTRNLVDSGNGKFNLMILCWPEGVASPIHDHAGSHCLMKVLEGGLKETRYAWPDEKGPKSALPLSLLLPSITDQSTPASVTEKKGCMEVTKETPLQLDQVAYIHDKIGLHRVSNPTNAPSVSLHLYCPPYETCKTFDEKTSACRGSGRAVFYSENGVVKGRSSTTAASPMDSKSPCVNEACGVHGVKNC